MRRLCRFYIHITQHWPSTRLLRIMFSTRDTGYPTRVGSAINKLVFACDKTPQQRTLSVFVVAPLRGRKETVEAVTPCWIFHPPVVDDGEEANQDDDRFHIRNGRSLASP